MAFYFNMNGKRWQYVREYLPEDRDGDCDSPDTPNKRIRIHKALKELEELYTIIHEARHAENWNMYDEGYVTKVCMDHARLLWRAGYRKLTPEQLECLNQKKSLS